MCETKSKLTEKKDIKYSCDLPPTSKVSGTDAEMMFCINLRNATGFDTSSCITVTLNNEGEVDLLKSFVH